MDMYDNKNDLHISNLHCDAREKYCQSIFTLKYLHVAKLNNKYFQVTNESFQKQSVFLLPSEESINGISLCSRKTYSAVVVVETFPYPTSFSNILAQE